MILKEACRRNNFNLLHPQQFVGIAVCICFIFRKLLNEIESFKHQAPKTPVSSEPKDKSSSSGVLPADRVVYELHYRPEMAKFKQDAKVECESLYPFQALRSSSFSLF